MTEKPPGPRSFSDEAVHKGTGKVWAEWYAILDEWGARSHSHREIAKHLREAHKLSGWWSQAVTNRYEWDRNLRPEQQQAKDTSA